MENEGILKIKPHTLQKYSILRKYLRVCKIFNDKYHNFVYVDTHGGSGHVSLEGKADGYVDGSPLIVAHYDDTWPCHICEIDPQTYDALVESVRDCENVRTYHGDCNEIIHEILGTMEPWKKFILFYVDPSGLVYSRSDGFSCDQLRHETISAITEFPRTELLLNFPLEAILRCAGDFFKNPEEPRAIANGKRVSIFMGTETWKELPRRSRTPRDFLELYINEMLEAYKFKGAYLVRSTEKNLPLYYLVYSTHNPIGAKIMRYIMNKEGDFPIHYNLILGRFPTFDEVYPLERFIFEQ